MRHAPEIPRPAITFEVGPSELMPHVDEYLAEGRDLARLSHRGEVFGEVVGYTQDGLRELLKIPEDYLIAFAGSASDAMDSVPRNMARRITAHLVNGAFSKRWYEFAGGAKRAARQLEAVWGQSFDLEGERVNGWLSSFNPELICLTHNETSTGVMLDAAQIAQLKERYPDALLAVDITSSTPYGGLSMENLDAALFSVQKGFGIPAGLGVLIASPEAVAKSKELEAVAADTGNHRSFTALAEAARKNQTPATPNMLGVYVLGRVVDDMLQTGMDHITAKTDQKAARLYDSFEKNGLQPFVAEASHRSTTTLVAETQGRTTEIIEQLYDKHDIAISSGYGKYGNTHIRIGNFPTHSLADVEYLIEALEDVV